MNRIPNITSRAKGLITVSGEVCSGDFHVYLKFYAGDPQYAQEYFSRCLCGKKRKVTTVKEVDV
jgi:hypothetical protein